MWQNNISAQKNFLTHSAVAHSPACGKWTQTRRIFFPQHFQPGFSKSIRTISKGFLRVFKVFPHSKGFESVSEIGSNILRNKSTLVVGIRATFTCFQHLRPENCGFLHETVYSLDFDYLESRQKRWYTYIYMVHTYILPNIWNKACIDAGNPGWSRTRPKLEIRSNKAKILKSTRTRALWPAKRCWCRKTFDNWLSLPSYCQITNQSVMSIFSTWLQISALWFGWNRTARSQSEGRNFVH